MVEIDTGKITAAQTEQGYIKFYKMKNYYNWEIKMHEGASDDDFKQLLAQIEQLNALMLTKFGGDI